MVNYFLSEKAKKAGCKFEKGRKDDAGYDICSPEEHYVLPGKQIKIRTGLHVAIPPGYVGIIEDRGSMADIRIYHHAGVMDESYRGEWEIIVENGGDELYWIDKGDKFCQVIIVPCYTEETNEVESVDDLGQTDRGAGKFGSTGK